MRLRQTSGQQDTTINAAQSLDCNGAISELIEIIEDLDERLNRAKDRLKNNELEINDL